MLARLLTKLVSCQSKAEKQIYNVMQSVHGKQAAALPQATFSVCILLCSDVLSFLWELISEYTADWLEPALFPK